MRIVVTRTGGFAGRTLRAAVETAGRPDAGRLQALARAAFPGRDGGGPPVPDGYVYEITVDDRTVRVGDPHLTAAQRDLVQAVLDGGAG